MKDWTYLRSELRDRGTQMVSSDGRIYNCVRTFDLAKWSTYKFPYYTVYIDSEALSVEATEDWDGVDQLQKNLIGVWIYAGFECQNDNGDKGLFDDAAEGAIDDVVSRFRGTSVANFDNLTYLSVFQSLEISTVSRMIADDTLTKGMIAVRGTIFATRQFYGE